MGSKTHCPKALGMKQLHGIWIAGASRVTAQKSLLVLPKLERVLNALIFTHNSLLCHNLQIDFCTKKKKKFGVHFIVSPDMRCAFILKQVLTDLQNAFNQQFSIMWDCSPP